MPSCHLITKPTPLAHHPPSTPVAAWLFYTLCKRAQIAVERLTELSFPCRIAPNTLLGCSCPAQPLEKSSYARNLPEMWRCQPKIAILAGCVAKSWAHLLPGCLAVIYLARPQQLKGRYDIQRPLSQGARVNLYRAIDTKTNRPCFIHQASLTMPDMDMRDALEQRFLQLAAVWQARRHPNILPILDAEVQNHRLYLITAPFRGRSLRSIINDRSQIIPEQTLLQWAKQLCDVLEYVHTQDPPIVLGCLSPSMITVDQGEPHSTGRSGPGALYPLGLVGGQPKACPAMPPPNSATGMVTPLSDL